MKNVNQTDDPNVIYLTVVAYIRGRSGIPELLSFGPSFAVSPTSWCCLFFRTRTLGNMGPVGSFHNEVKIL